MTEPVFSMQARNETVADLIGQAARKEIAFSGPDSLHTKISAMGFSTTSLYEMVISHPDCIN